MRLLSLWMLCVLPCLGQQDPMPTFGTTVVMSKGMRGDIYFLPELTTKLPNFQKLTPKGAIYTNVLHVPPRDFSEGFPGVTDRFEWFAIDYSGQFWIQHPDKYEFFLFSDDGSKLYIDGKRIIDNDGQHAAIGRTGSVTLKAGLHRIRVSYFQGPRFHVALMLDVRRRGEDFHPFNMDHFLPPPE
jgi:hypothetical protein